MLEDRQPVYENPVIPIRERRSAPHLRTMRVAALIRGDVRELCIVRNVSEGGVMLQVYSRLDPGQLVQVELKSGRLLAGPVTWVNGSNAGVQFDEKISVSEILAHAAGAGGKSARTPRIDVYTRARLRMGSRVYHGTAVNVSQSGLRIQTCTDLPSEIDVVVTLQGMEPIQAVLRWYRDGVAAISFNSLIPLPRLAKWLQEHRAPGEGKPLPQNRARPAAH